MNSIYTHMDILNIRQQLPHGAIKEIAYRTNYSESSISQFFKGKISLSKSSDILNAAADVLEEHKTKEREAIKKLTKALDF